MTERELLLRGVLGHPADDLRRLVLADYMEEHGEGVRAEFVRLQVEAARLRDPARAGASPENDAEQDELQASYDGWYARYVGGLGAPARTPFPDDPRWLCGPVPETRAVEAVWARGWVDELRLSTATLLRHAEALFRSHPVAKVTLLDKGPVSSVLATAGANWTSYHFGSEAACLDWVSRACVAYGRRAAGLRPL